MEELKVKKDFTGIYTEEFPNEYLKEMKRLDYRIPDKTKPLYLYLARQLYKKISKTLKILDVGSSYGINSALLRHDMKMSDLDDFFLEKEPTKDQTRRFFQDLPSDDSLSFFQIDISEPALKFSEHVQLCKKGICVNLETENLQDKEIPETDMIISTGCIGYIGYKGLSNLFEFIKKQQSRSNLSILKRGPIFAFSVLRIFDMEKIKKTFEDYGYSLIKNDLKPIRQRRFSDLEEKDKTISLLHNKGLKTKLCEDDGYFYADFYMASPKKMKPQLISMSKDMKKQVDDWTLES